MFTLKFAVWSSIVAVIYVSGLLVFIAYTLLILAYCVILFMDCILVAHFTLKIWTTLIIVYVFRLLIMGTGFLSRNLRLNYCWFNYICLLFLVIFKLLLGLINMFFTILLGNHHCNCIIFMFALLAEAAFTICFVKFIYCLTIITYPVVFWKLYLNFF